MKLISSNIRFDNPQDGENAWGFRKNILKEVLLNYEPDIICTQEGRRPQLQDFEDTLESFQLVDRGRDWISERMYPSIYLKKNQFNLLHFQDIWLSDTPEIPGSSSFDSTFPRLACWIKLKQISTQRVFNLVNVHLDHKLENTRIKQVSVLCSELTRLNVDRANLIIAGDFNAAPESQVQHILRNELTLTDSWNIFHGQDIGSHHKFNGDNLGSSRIDWVLHGENIATKELFLDLSHINGKWPSDHFPLKAHLNFKS